MTREAIVDFLSGDLLMVVYGWLCVVAIVAFGCYQVFRYVRRFFHGHQAHHADHRVDHR